MVRAVAIAVALTCLAALACTDATGPRPAARVLISPDSTFALRGDILTFTVAVLDASGRPTGGTVVWASSDTSVVAVGTSGIGIARSKGAAWVRASVATIADSARVQVWHDLLGVVILPTPLAVRTGASRTLSAVAFDSAGDSSVAFPTAWVALDTSVAKITSTGVVTGRKVDTTTIFAAIRGHTASVPLRVYSAVASITFGPDTLTIVPGAAVFDLTIVRDSAGRALPGDQATWTSSNPAVARISANGDTIAAVAVGTATLVGAADGRVDTVSVLVRQASLRSAAPGYQSACGVSADSIAFCWGGYGSFGWGEDSAARPTVSGPLALANAGGFVLVDAGNSFGCGLRADSTSWCWGYTISGRMGNPSITGSVAVVPVPVQTTMRFHALSVGNNHVCAIGSDSAAYCWGHWAPYTVATTPLAFTAPAPFLEISAGLSYTCGITADSSAYCWGENSYGALGTGNDTSTTAPTLVAGGYKWVSISAGGTHACGLVAGGQAYCWGTAFGVLGSDSVARSTVPVPVDTALMFARVFTGGTGYSFDHTCAITGDGTAYCWGANTYGELGDGTTTNAVTPVLVAGGLKWQSLEVGDDVTCGESAAGVVYCWGFNLGWKVGDGTTINRNVPTRVLGQP